jgi:hypothetical protein
LIAAMLVSVALTIVVLVVSSLWELTICFNHGTADAVHPHLIHIGHSGRQACYVTEANAETEGWFGLASLDLLFVNFTILLGLAVLRLSGPIGRENALSNKSGTR